MSASDMLAESGIDAASLRRPVSAALGERADVISFDVKALGYRNTNPVTASIARVSGLARAEDSLRPWSMVVKTIHPVSEADAQRWFGKGLPPALLERATDVYRWDREVHAYASPLLRAGAGLVAPRCLASIRESDRAFIFLEDLGEGAETWSLADYAGAARDLGRLNGTHASSPPSDEWLCRDWLRTWVALGPHRGFSEWPTAEEFDDDAVRRRFPAAALAELKALHADAAGRAAACEMLPRTLVHMDAFRSNLFLRRGDHGTTTVAVDWSYVGLACVGADLAQLVVGSAYFAGEDVDVDALEAATFAAYRDGLREAGYESTVSTLWRAYADNVIARWGFPGALTYSIRTARDPTARAAWEARTKDSIDRRLRLNVERLAYVRDVASRSGPR
jgi:aminoglycoside/choline kinase family phosphotransferase